MKKIFFLLIFTLLLNCSNQKKVYWCGDHPCINKAEKEAYFKKYMIVEVKKIDKNTKKNNSETEKLLLQAKEKEKKRIINEKELAKQAKLDEKRRKKEEKELAKQEKLDEKRRLKQEKQLAKQAKREEKIKKKEKSKISEDICIKDQEICPDKQVEIVKKQELKNQEKITDESTYKVKNNKIGDFSNETILNKSKFSDLVENIYKKNSNRSYPEINDIPN